MIFWIQFCVFVLFLVKILLLSDVYEVVVESMLLPWGLMVDVFNKWLLDNRSYCNGLDFSMVLHLFALISVPLSVWITDLQLMWVHAVKDLLRVCLWWAVLLILSFYIWCNVTQMITMHWGFPVRCIYYSLEPALAAWQIFWSFKIASVTFKVFVNWPW